MALKEGKSNGIEKSNEIWKSNGIEREKVKVMVLKMSMALKVMALKYIYGIKSNGIKRKKIKPNEIDNR